MDYGYIYYVRNEINDKMYIGKVTCQSLFFHREYRGSGVELYEAFKEFGKECFSIHYIAAAKDGEELTQLEKYYLKYYNIPNQNFYNKKIISSNGEQSKYFNRNNIKGVNLKNIICYNYKTNITKVFNNIRQFCEDNNMIRGNVFNVLSGKRITHRDCILYYENNPLSDDAIKWILNYKTGTSYKTKYIAINEVKKEIENKYNKEMNKRKNFIFNGYYIESGKEIQVQWDLIKSNYKSLITNEGEAPIEEHIISNRILDLKPDNKFEMQRKTDYKISSDNLTLYFNYNEINNLSKIYKDINPILLRQAIKRNQKTVMNKKFLIFHLK